MPSTGPLTVPDLVLELRQHVNEGFLVGWILVRRFFFEARQQIDDL
jgi:hypothetical protein